MARVFVGCEAQIIQAKQHHTRRAIRPVERRLAGQREVRHPFGKPRTKIRAPQKLRGFLPVHRGHTALGLQHFARPAVDFPAHIKTQLRFDAHRTLRLRDPSRMPANTRRVNRYSHTTKFSSLLTTSGLRTRFSSTYPPHWALRRCRSCAEMLVSP